MLLTSVTLLLSDVTRIVALAGGPRWQGGIAGRDQRGRVGSAAARHREPGATSTDTAPSNSPCTRLAGGHTPRPTRCCAFPAQPRQASLAGGRAPRQTDPLARPNPVRSRLIQDRAWPTRTAWPTACRAETITLVTSVTLLLSDVTRIVVLAGGPRWQGATGVGDSGPGPTGKGGVGGGPASGAGRHVDRHSLVKQPLHAPCGRAHAAADALLRLPCPAPPSLARRRPRSAPDRSPRTAEPRALAADPRSRLADRLPDCLARTRRPGRARPFITELVSAGFCVHLRGSECDGSSASRSESTPRNSRRARLRKASCRRR